MIDITFNETFADLLGMVSTQSELGIEQIAYIWLPLSFGNLQYGALFEKRMKQVRKMMKNTYMDARHFQLRYQKKALETIAAIKEDFAAGETLRIWYEMTANSYLALLYLLSELKGIKGEIFIVCAHEQNLPFELRRFGFGAAQPEEVELYFPHAVKLTEEHRESYECEWEAISQEPGTFRVILNGHLTNVPECFYDSTIECYFPRNTVFDPIRCMGPFLADIPGVDSDTMAWRFSNILQGPNYRMVEEKEPNSASYMLLKRYLFERIG